MNRLFHIRETLLKNIDDSRHMTNIEFVLLDYNSSDGLENWVRQELSEYIEKGVVKYVRTNEPLYFDRSHSRNLAINVSSGNIIALLDADNYLGQGYLQWLCNIFDEANKDIIVTTIRKDGAWYGDQAGKCAFFKEKFHQIRGFDEAMFGYGFEDIDLVNRLDLEGENRVYINEPSYLKFIKHSYYERINNEFMMKNISAIFSLEPSGDSKNKHVLYLMADSQYIQVFYSHDPITANSLFYSYFGYEINNSNVTKGTYLWQGNQLILQASDNYNTAYLVLDEESETLSSQFSEVPWSKIEETMNSYILNIMMYSECWNRFRFRINREKTESVNPNGWGKGNVFINFSIEPFQIN